MPRELAENDREALAEHLSCNPEKLRYDWSPIGDLQPQPPLAVPGGYRDGREIDVRATACFGGLERRGRADQGGLEPR